MFADVGNTPAVITGNNDGGGQWMWAIVLLALLGGGFGGNRCDNGRDVISDNMNSKFLETNDNIRQTELLTQSQISNLGVSQYQQSIFRELCDTNRNIDDKAYNLENCVQTTKYDTGMAIKDLALSNQECCCATQKEILINRYENEKQTCAIMAGQTQNTQLILERLSQNEIQNLRDKVSDLQLNLSQCNQNNFLVRELRPCPTPAYPAWNPYQQVPLAAYNVGVNAGCCGSY